MKIVFIHGNGAMSWKFAWTPWLKQELEKLDIDCIFETFPDSILARSEYWLEYLQDYIKADKDTLLIGRSSGAVAAMRYAEQHKILGSILISPSYTDLGLESEKISGYFNSPRDWNSIRKNQKTISLFYSSNDEFIPESEFEYITNHINPETVRELGQGHFMYMEEFPELLEEIKNKYVYLHK